MVVPIILSGSSILRNQSFAVSKNDDFQQLSQDLFDTLKNVYRHWLGNAPDWHTKKDICHWYFAFFKRSSDDSTI
jgi:hypothetical protein